MMKKLFVCGLLLQVMIGMAQEKPASFGMMDEDLPKGLAVGDTAPEIHLHDQNGDHYSLKEALKQGPVVLTFYRGNWCPYCSRHLSNITDSLLYIIEAGASFVAVSPESTEETKETSINVEDKINLLSDKKGVVMRDYDVDFKVTQAYQDKLKTKLKTDLKESNKQEVAVLPVPATYVIGTDGTIIYRHFDKNYRTRPSVKSVLEVLN